MTQKEQARVAEAAQTMGVSERQAWCIVALEHMACSTPIVSNVPAEAARLLADSGAGRTVPAGDPAAPADAVPALRATRQPGWIWAGKAPSTLACIERGSPPAERYLGVLGGAAGSAGER